MKANELMIGDWVTVSRPSNRREKVSVKSVIGNGTIEAKTKDGLVVFGEMAVEPIPLTGEILDKNGWFGTDEPLIEFRGCGKWNRKYKDIEYVHELQHALRLCGVEKEIIL